GISFVHYLLYLAVLHERERVAFPTFLRDAILFKALSFATLAWCYLSVFRADAMSLALIGAGFGLATLAMRALGIERSYFGAELGVLPPERISRFPYGVIPHPMIVGAVIGLLGVQALPEMRASQPWLVPTHIAFYTLVLAHELAVRDRTPQ